MPEREPYLRSAITRSIKFRFKRMDLEVKVADLPTATLDMLSRAGIQPKIHWEDSESREKLSQGPALVVVNHPNLMEPVFAIAALPPRKDVSLLATTKLTELVGPNTNEHLIPIHLDPDTAGSRMPEFISRQLETMLNRTERVGENMQAIRNVIKVLSSGEIVVMCPSGNSITDGQWNDGLGSIIRSMNRKKGGKDTNIAFAHVAGTSKFDPLIVGLKTGKIRGMIPVVRFGEARSIGKILGDNKDISRSEITRQLHEEYLDWTSKFNK